MIDNEENIKIKNVGKKIKRYNIPIFIPHEGCPHSCVFCNQKKITGVHTSVTFDDARRIIEEYLNFLPNDERYTEIAFFGGSFTGLPIDVQEGFLKVASEYGESTDGIRMSTRPDYINNDILSLAKAYNVRTIELGLQSSDDEVLRMNEREHVFSQTVHASRLIKEYGISLGLQFMIGMYASSPEKDIKTAYDTAALKPECARIYPTLTLKGTKLEELYKSGQYTPYDLKTAVEVCDEAMSVLEKNDIEIIRVGLHSDESLTSGDSIVAGPYHPAFKELVITKRYREKTEEKIISGNIRNCVMCEEIPKSDVSAFVGHNRCNKKYFKEKYNVDIKAITTE